MVVVGWCGPPTEIQTITVPTSSKPSMMYVWHTHCTITYGTTDDYGTHIQPAINDVCLTYSLYHHLRNYRRLRYPHPASHQWYMSDILIVPSPTELQTITVPTSSKPSMMYVRHTHCSITYGTIDDYGPHIQQAINDVCQTYSLFHHLRNYRRLRFPHPASHQWCMSDILIVPSPTEL